MWVQTTVDEAERKLSLGYVSEALKHVKELEVYINVNSGEKLKMLGFCSTGIAV